jgi:hypothetical protein
MDCMSRTLSLQARFWGILISDDYTLERLQNSTSQIQVSSEATRQSLQRIISLNPKSSLYRRLYSQFLLNVINDEAGAKRQLNRAVELEEEHDGSISLTDSRNCIMIISGERENIGQVLEANDKTCEVFEVSTEDIIGKKINLLMSRAFAPIHNSLLIRYIEYKKAGQVSTMRSGMTMKNASGFVFEGDLQVREYANFTLDPSIAFFGLIKPLPLRMFCVVKQTDLSIWDVSRHYFQFFNTDMQKLRNYEIKISDDLVDWDEYYGLIQKAVSNGESFTFQTVLENNNHETTLQVTVEGLQYAAKDYFKVLFDIKDGDMSKLTQESKEGGKGRYGDYGKDAKSNARSVQVYEGSDAEDSSDSYDSKSEEPEEEEENSVASSSKSANLLRMGLMRTNNNLDSSLRYLLIWIVSLLAVLCAMGISVQVLWSELTINHYKATLDILMSPVQTGTNTATYSAFLFEHLFNETLFSTPEERDSEEKRLRRDLSRFRDELDAFRKNIYDHSVALSRKEVDLIQDSRIGLHNYDGMPMELDVVETIHQYSVAITMILNKNFDELKADRRPLRFIITNRNNTIATTWDQICQFILKNQDENNKTVQTMEFAFMISAVSLVTLISFTVFFPTVYIIFKQSADVYALFEKLEQGNMRDIYGQCIQRLTELEGIESAANNMELQDMMEVIASKRSHSAADGNKASKVRIRVISVLFNRATLQLFMIMIITVTYFLGYYLWWMQLHTSLFDSINHRVYYGVMRSYYTRRITLNAIQYSADAGKFDINTTDSKDWEVKLWDVDHALFFGDPEFNIDTDIRFMNGGNDILSKSLCDMYTQYKVELYDNPPCTSFLSSALTQSTREVIVSFLSLSEDLRKTYNDDSYTKPELEDKIKTLKSMADNWIPDSYRIFNRWIRDSFTLGFAQASSSRQIGTISYIIVCIVSVFALYYPMVKKMNRDIRQTRNLLMIIPPEVIESSKTLREMVRGIALRMLQSQ